MSLWVLLWQLAAGKFPWHGGPKFPPHDVPKPCPPPPGHCGRPKSGKSLEDLGGTANCPETRGKIHWCLLQQVLPPVQHLNNNKKGWMINCPTNSVLSGKSMEGVFRNGMKFCKTTISSLLTNPWKMVIFLGSLPVVESWLYERRGTARILQSPNHTPHFLTEIFYCSFIIWNGWSEKEWATMIFYIQFQIHPLSQLHVPHSLTVWTVKMGEISTMLPN